MVAGRVEEVVAIGEATVVVVDHPSPSRQDLYELQEHLQGDRELHARRQSQACC